MRLPFAAPAVLAAALALLAALPGGAQEKNAPAKLTADHWQPRLRHEPRRP